MADDGVTNCRPCGEVHNLHPLSAAGNGIFGSRVFEELVRYLAVLGEVYFPSACEPEASGEWEENPQVGARADHEQRRQPIVLSRKSGKRRWKCQRTKERM